MPKIKYPLIQIFILTHNRPRLVMRAVKSALEQDYENYEVIVSDNSTNDDTQNLFQKFQNYKLKYVQRIPSLPVEDHFNRILSEVKGEFFVLFHDDDEMCKNHISTLYEKLSDNADCVAAGANAYIKGKFIRRSFVPISQRIEILSSKNEVAKNYLKSSFVPFASYLYSKVVAQKTCFDIKEAGKNGDVTFLMKVSDVGKILVTSSPLMTTYFHDEQDSASEVFPSSLMLVSYIIKHTTFERKSVIVKRFRTLCLYVDICNKFVRRDPFPFSNWNFKKLKIILKISPLNFFPKLLIRLILSTTHLDRVLRIY